MRRLILGGALISLGALFAVASPAGAVPEGRVGGEGHASGALLGDGAEATAGAAVRTAGVGGAAAGGRGPQVRCKLYLLVGELTPGPPALPVDQPVENGLYRIVCVEVGSDALISDRTELWQPGEPAPSVDPFELAQMQAARLVLPAPAVRTSPDAEGNQWVRVPVWLWVSSPWEAVSETAYAGSVWSQVTAAPRSVVWSMGDGTSVTCGGPGVAFDLSRSESEQSTDCSHTYERTSVGQPGERFPVSATVTWEVSWRSNVAGGGVLGESTSTTEFGLRVAQIQAILQ
jgi:hypothetical protein